jgi:hypothetical protein
MHGTADEEEDTEQVMLSEDYRLRWAIGNMLKPVQQHMESFRQQHVRLDQPRHLGQWDVTNYIRGRDMKHGLAELIVPAVVKHYTGTTSATLSATTFRELMQTPDIVIRQSEILLGGC